MSMISSKGQPPRTTRTQGREQDEISRRLAAEAARLMAEQGIEDPAFACRKAATRLGLPDKRLFPKNSVILEALGEYQRLFLGEKHAAELRRLRKAALHAMEALEKFHPRLVGPVFHGTAGATTPVQLHLFADTPEEVVFFLLDHGIPWSDDQSRCLFSDGQRKTVPLFRFRAGDTEIRLWVFPKETQGNPPLSLMDQKPEVRASLGQLKTMLAQSG